MSFVTIRQLSERTGKDRGNLLRFVKKNGYKVITLDRVPGSRGASVSAVSTIDADTIENQLNEDRLPSTLETTSKQGFFYAIAVVPELAPNRIKLGFASDIAIRLASHKTSAPTATLLKSWPCKYYWELTAIDSITRTDATLILGEVYEFISVSDMLQRADDFFAQMQSGNLQK